MLNKKMITSAMLLGMVSVGFTGKVSADEGDTQTIEGKDGQTSAEIITRGNLGDIDPTDPETPLPEGDDRWLKVTLPTAVVFESKDKKNIYSPNNYEIINESGRPVKVDVESYTIEGGKGKDALTSLNIMRTDGFEGAESIKLVENSVARETINEELARLANHEGKYGEEDNAPASTKFEFTGTMDETKLQEKQNYVDSKLKFKFTALRMDGQTIDEVK